MAKKLAIIGGGASGLAAAVAATRELCRATAVQGEFAIDCVPARNSAHEQAQVEVTVYEAGERIGRSILATGNGRCNFSNAFIDPSLFRNGEFVSRALTELRGQYVAQMGKATRMILERDPVREFLADVGLAWREESEGRLYPLANKATSVLDVLRAAAANAGVREVCDRAAVRVDVPEREGDCFHVRFADGSIEHADAVIVAAGGRWAEKLELPSDLKCTPGRPVLGPLCTDTSMVKHLNNIRVRCALELVRPDTQRARAALRAQSDTRAAAVLAKQDRVHDCGRVVNAQVWSDERGTLIARETGELLFREYGVSGIAVFNLSRFAEPGDVLFIDLMPNVRSCDMESYLYARRKRMVAGARSLTCEAYLRGLVLPQVARAVLYEANMLLQASFEKSDVAALARVLKGLPLVVRGVGDAGQCQVTRGGYAVDAFDARTMEARALPGLYVVGEALDVDAPCGGFNLHWAWGSGMLAGRAAVWAMEGIARMEELPYA